MTSSIRKRLQIFALLLASSCAADVEQSPVVLDEDQIDVVQSELQGTPGTGVCTNYQAFNSFIDEVIIKHPSIGYCSGPNSNKAGYRFNSNAAGQWRIEVGWYGGTICTFYRYEIEAHHNGYWTSATPQHFVFNSAQSAKDYLRSRVSCNDNIRAFKVGTSDYNYYNYWWWAVSN